MQYIADLHIHSRFSRATSKNMTLEAIERFAQLKGVTLIGTGDFTHPLWFKEIKEKLVPAEEGLFKLKSPSSEYIPASCKRDVRFLLSAEISNIYSKNGRTRKIHNLILVPAIEDAVKINARLGRIGNLSADGRPILGLDSKVLLEIVLGITKEAVFIPAHAWTPHFSIFGSISGFNSISECFEELSSHIKAIETGLSSDPMMNWRVKDLDKITLVSNSDAHSPEKIGREANIFEGKLSYGCIRNAIRERKGFKGTIEFFPEEGKYHFDGHRLCKVCLSPSETRKLKSVCPQCGKKLTIGVMYRVEELAEREGGFKPADALPFHSLVPLMEIMAQVRGVGAGSKAISKEYYSLLENLGSELSVLMDAPIEDIERSGSPLIAEGIRRMRERKIRLSPGYDGEYGKIEVLSEKEKDSFDRQLTFF